MGPLDGISALMRRNSRELASCLHTRTRERPGERSQQEGAAGSLRRKGPGHCSRHRDWGVPVSRTVGNKARGPDAHLPRRGRCAWFHRLSSLHRDAAIALHKCFSGTRPHYEIMYVMSASPPGRGPLGCAGVPEPETELQTPPRSGAVAPSSRTEGWTHGRL